MNLRALAATLSMLGGCAAGPQDAPGAPCDPLSVGACGEDRVCAVTDDGPRCRFPTDAPAGAACGAASCPDGYACATVEGLVACRPVCDVEEPARRPCPADSPCRYRLGQSTLGVCALPCAPDDPCDAGSCGISTALPHPICVAPGPARPDESCAGRRCVAGWACLELESTDDPERLEERCAELCDPSATDATECTSGSCRGRILGVDGIGYCADDS